MHVHTTHSGLCNIPLIKSVCNESYTEPKALYAKLKRQGMSLVTVTDHDSIDAAEELRGYADFFVSEEVTCTLPSGSTMHVGVYDVSERQHEEIQRRRDDFPSFAAYLREQGLLFSANHIYSSLTGPRAPEDFELFAAEFEAFETLNGCMLEVTNRSAAELARVLGKAGVGGSDAHTLSTAGVCWTEVRGARTKSEFLSGIRRGYATAHGTPGNYFRLTRDILGIGLSMVRSRPSTAPVALLGGLVPLITLVNYCMERQFAGAWRGRIAEAQGAGLAQEAAAA